MKEYSWGHQKFETHRQFEKLLQEAGIEADGLEVRSLAADHLILLDGAILGRYRYMSGNFEATNGHKYNWKKEQLTCPDGSCISATFAEALRAIVSHK